jgi:hypothetical protein
LPLWLYAFKWIFCHAEIVSHGRDGCQRGTSVRPTVRLHAQAARGDLSFGEIWYTEYRRYL